MNPYYFGRQFQLDLLVNAFRCPDLFRRVLQLKPADFHDSGCQLVFCILQDYAVQFSGRVMPFNELQRDVLAELQGGGKYPIMIADLQRDGVAEILTKMSDLPASQLDSQRFMLDLAGFKEHSVKARMQAGEDMSLSVAYAEAQAFQNCLLPDQASAPAAVMPWNLISTDVIYRDLQGSHLEAIEHACSHSMHPPLLLELSLLPTLVLAGCALSQPIDRESWRCDNIVTDLEGTAVPRPPNTKLGAEHLRFRIPTRHGLSTNIYGLLIANSAAGKDAAPIRQLGNKLDLDIGDVGSVEGTKDALARRGSGIIRISEFIKFFDSRSRESAAIPFFTDAFNKGSFEYNMSNRTGVKTQRKTNFCFPSILAGVQPDVLDQHDPGTMWTQGFFPRFLATLYTGKTIREGARDACKYWDAAKAELDFYFNVQGEMDIRDGYSLALQEKFMAYAPEHDAIWRRYCSEYYPKFVALYACDPVHPTPEDWAKAERLVWWFFGQVIKVIRPGGEDRNTTRIMNLCAKVEEALRTAGSTLTKRQLGRGALQRVRPRDRDEVYRKLETDGIVNISGKTSSGSETVTLRGAP